MSAPGASWDGLFESHGRQEARYLLRGYKRCKCGRCGKFFTHLILVPQVEAGRLESFYYSRPEYDERGKRWMYRACWQCWITYLARRLYGIAANNE